MLFQERDQWGMAVTSMAGHLQGFVNSAINLTEQTHLQMLPFHLIDVLLEQHFDFPSYVL